MFASNGDRQIHGPTARLVLLSAVILSVIGGTIATISQKAMNRYSIAPNTLFHAPYAQTFLQGLSGKQPFLLNSRHT